MWCFALVSCYGDGNQLRKTDYIKWCGSNMRFQRFEMQDNTLLYVKIVTPECNVLQGNRFLDNKNLIQTISQGSNIINLLIKTEKEVSNIEQMKIIVNDTITADQIFIFNEQSFLMDSSRTYIAEFSSELDFIDLRNLYGQIDVGDKQYEFHFDYQYFEQIPELFLNK